MSVARYLYVDKTQTEGPTGPIGLTGPTGISGNIGPTGPINTKVQEVTNEPTGHVERTATIISFTGTTGSNGSFTISPVSGSYNVWVQGNEFNISNTQTVTISSTADLYYIYFDNTGTLGVQNTFFIWDQQAPTAYIYYNPSKPDEYMLFDERHGITMDWATHEYLHRTRGAAIANGFGINYPTLEISNPTNSDLSFNLTQGTFFDEDLEVNITDGTPGIWSTGLNPVLLPVLYLDGSGNWRKTTSANVPLLNNTIGTRPYYNIISNNTGTLNTVPNNNFINMWIVATNMAYTPILSIMGQNYYTNLQKAQETQWEELNLNGLPIVELRPLYQMTYRCSNSYTNNDYLSSLYYVTDIRSFSSITGISSSNVGPIGPTGLIGPTGPQGEKTFIIDHPIDTNKYLVHACLEGPEAGVYYRGEGEISNNEFTTIYLPSYVSYISKNFTVQLSVKYNAERKSQISLQFTDIIDNTFKVYGENCKFHWIVYGERRSINVEPYKNIVNVKGSGPYKWI